MLLEHNTYLTQVDYVKIISEDLIHKLNKKIREKIVPYPRSGLKRKQSSKHTSESTTEASKSQSGHSKKETKSSSAIDTSPSHPSPPTLVVSEMHKEAQQAAGGPTSLGDTSEEGAHPQLSSVKLEDLSNILKDTRSAFFTLDSPTDEPIIVSDESEEEENVENDKDTKDTSVPPPSLKLAQIQELMDQHELSKLLASHDFASCLTTQLKELPLKINELSGEIKELKQHIKEMEIELPGDLKDIPSKLEIFTSTISNLLSLVAELKNIQWELPAEFLDLPHLVSSVQEKFKTLDSLLGLLPKVTDTLNRFDTLVGNASGATAMSVPSADKATASPAEWEKDADTYLKNELVDLLGIDIVRQYYNKKLLYEKYCETMKKRRQSSKIINCDVLTKKGHISLKVYREDGTAEVIKKFKASDLQLAECREVVQACPDRKEKGWKTIYELIKTRMKYLEQTEKELHIDFNKSLQE
ncbi:hypothetical protein Tco_0563394 [Tanacetum coccineum]